MYDLQDSQIDVTKMITLLAMCGWVKTGLVQLKGVADSVSKWDDVVVAYEPVWAPVLACPEHTPAE